MPRRNLNGLATGSQHRFDLTVFVDCVQFAVRRTCLRTEPRGDPRSGDFGQKMGAVRIGQSNDGPLQTQAGFAPDDLRGTGRLGFQLARTAIGNVRVFMPVFLDIDSGGANTADPATTDSIIAQRVKQNEKLARVSIGRR